MRQERMDGFGIYFSVEIGRIWIELDSGRGELQLSIVLDGLGMECLRHLRCCHNVDLTQGED